MKTLFTTFVLLIVAAATQAGGLDRPTPSFEYRFYFWKPSPDTTSYWLLFPPLPGKEVIAYFVLTNDDGKRLGQFPLREMSYRDKDGKVKVKYGVSCLSDELISSTAHLNLIVKTRGKSEKDEWYQLKLKAAKLRPKGKL